MSDRVPPSIEQDAEEKPCDHLWKYETYHLSIGAGPARDMYRCMRCLDVKWVKNWQVFCD